MKRFLSALLLFIASVALAQPQRSFEFRDGDRVVFLGDTLMEREQYYGYIELALAGHSPATRVTFRNLGWSADTPEGASRFGLSKLQAGHEPADEGWRQLLDQIELTKPTVVFLGYGMANSFAGADGLAKFSTDLNKLIDAILEKNKVTRFVLLSPIRHENLGSPLPNPAKHNQSLAQYSDAVRAIAEKRGFPFISLFDRLKLEASKTTRRPLTDNGIHLNAEGYKQAAAVIEKELGWKPGQWKKLPNAEAVRREILKKNELFFNRSRPQNMAYLFGFRKHEQGQNAVEIPKFDPLLDAKDKLIHTLLVDRSSKSPATSSVKAVAAPKQITPQPLPTFEVADGLEVNLYAESPSLAKPIQMNFDPQGRLWIASSEVYPQIEPGKPASDKILVLEDTNRDGKADKSTVFVDKLLVPTTVIPGDGGVYVGQSTELLHFKDTNGDGKSDQRRIVLSSFGTEDTHHNIHTLRWGPEGNLYFNQSIYTRTDIETPNNVVRLKSGGIFNFNQQKMDLEVFLFGFCNPWGHIFDEYGQSFATDGCGGQGICYGIRGATYFTYAKMRREMKSITPGNYPKFCGLELIRSEHFPKDFQGSLVTCDFRAHRVVRFSVTEDGAGYAAQEKPDLLRTTNVTFRPIDVKLGPDGALYVADWANPIIQHGEVDFRDPRRDHEHGRVWRITAKNRPLVKAPKLVGAKTEDLLNQLLSPNDFNRNQARRVLNERGDKIKKDLGRWIGQQTDERALLEALWMYQSIDVVESTLLHKVLLAKDGRTRAGGVRVLSFWQDRIPDAKELLADAVSDSHPRVRLEAVRALAKAPSVQSAELILRALEKPVDSFIDYGLWLSINDIASQWVEAVTSGAWPVKGHEKQLEFALKAIDPSLARGVLEKVVAAQTIPRDGSGPWIELIGQSGGPAELQKIYQQLLNGGFNDDASARVISALSEAARLRNVKPTSDIDGITKLFAANGKAQSAAVRLAGTWKSEKAKRDLFGVAFNPKSSPAIQKAAFESLREIGGKDVSDALQSALEETDDHPLLKDHPLLSDHPLLKDHPLLHQSAALTLSSLNLDKATPHLVKSLAIVTNDADSLELWRSILNIKNSAKKLAASLPQGFPEAVAKTGLKAAREGSRNEPELVLALNKAANLDDSEKSLTADELKQLTESVAKGDPFKGENIYRRSDLACANCHSIGGAGGKVGPDLTSIGASAPVDYLIESVLFPNKKIKEGYHSIQVQTKEEQEYSGILVRESDQELVLRDSASKEVSIPKNKIDSRKNGASLMPSGLVDAMSAEERADLFRFLSELGKPGPFDASKGNIARSWKLFVLTVDQDQFGTDKLVAGDTTVGNWQQLFTTVNGKLSKADLQSFVGPIGTRAVAVYALTRLQLPTAANVHLKFGTTSASDVWANGKSIGRTRAVTTDSKSVPTVSDLATELSQGKNSIVVRIDPKNLPDEIRLESTDGTFLLE